MISLSFSRTYDFVSFACFYRLSVKEDQGIFFQCLKAINPAAKLVQWPKYFQCSTVRPWYPWLYKVLCSSLLSLSCMTSAHLFFTFMMFLLLSNFACTFLSFCSNYLVVIKLLTFCGFTWRVCLYSLVVEVIVSQHKIFSISEIFQTILFEFVRWTV